MRSGRNIKDLTVSDVQARWFEVPLCAYRVGLLITEVSGWSTCCSFIVRCPPADPHLARHHAQSL